LRIWVDCTAAAHPVVLRPVVGLLRERGHEVSITARGYGQTEGLLDRMGLEYESFGSHGGASTVAKARALAGRSASLARWARPKRFDLAIAHGSVDVAAVGTVLRIPQAQMQDYEFAGLQRKLAWRAARRVIVPDAIPLERLEAAGARAGKLVRYPGLKEDYYLADFVPDPAVLAELGLGELGVRPVRGEDEAILAVVRPPPETSAYHADNPLYERLLDRLGADPRVVTVLIPRTEGQGEAARARNDSSLVVPDRAIDAQSLIAHADAVVSAGGTMNREAVALGVPVWTIFSGRMGAVDEALIAAGRLLELADPDALELRKRDREPGPVDPRDPAVLVDGALGAAGNGGGVG
jgi:predicted glycosyltransferase